MQFTRLGGVTFRAKGDPTQHPDDSTISVLKINLRAGHATRRFHNQASGSTSARQKQSPSAEGSLPSCLTKVVQFGGYLARTKNPPPGNTVMWRGPSSVTDINLEFTFARTPNRYGQSQALPNAYDSYNRTAPPNKGRRLFHRLPVSRPPSQCPSGAWRYGGRGGPDFTRPEPLRRARAIGTL